MILVGNEKFHEEIKGFVSQFQFQKMSLDVFEIAQVEFRQVIILSSKVLEVMTKEVKYKLERAPIIMIYNDTGRELPFCSDNFVFEFSSKSNMKIVQNQITLWDKQLQQYEFMRSHFVSLQQEIITMSEKMNGQLGRIKKIYEIQTPLRKLKSKGVEIVSKYSVGEDRSSEYFDFHKSDNKISIFMTKTNSYLASALMMKIFQEEKDQGLFGEKKQLLFLKTLREEVNELLASDDIKTQILIAELDLSTFNIKGFNLGSFRFVSSHHNEFETRHLNLNSEFDSSLFEIQLNRSERLLIHSQGFERSWSQKNNTGLIEDILTDKKLNSQEILDELFFKVKQGRQNSFTDYDCSVIYVEVSKNAILKI